MHVFNLGVKIIIIKGTVWYTKEILKCYVHPATINFVNNSKICNLLKYIVFKDNV